MSSDGGAKKSTKIRVLRLRKCSSRFGCRSYRCMLRVFKFRVSGGRILQAFHSYIRLVTRHLRKRVGGLCKILARNVSAGIFSNHISLRPLCVYGIIRPENPSLVL